MNTGLYHARYIPINKLDELPEDETEEIMIISGNVPNGPIYFSWGNFAEYIRSGQAAEDGYTHWSRIYPDPII